MNIGVLIPTRGDRPLFLQHALWLLEKQTLAPTVVEIVNDPPLNSGKDISYRYRIGIERIYQKSACDLVFLWEDDDWYAPDYLETMTRSWQENGRPDIFGLNTTLYYHIVSNGWNLINHPGRASAMSTVVSSKIKDISWCPDNHVWTDLYLWKVLKGKAVSLDRPINVGIKHGIGVCGGIGHQQHSLYKNTDRSQEYLRSLVDPVSFEFYQSIRP